MIHVFDTETTGFPLWREPSEHPGQPHLVQLASLMLDDAGREEDAINVIIRPEGWTIPDEVAAIHGITTEIAMAKGIPLGQAIMLFARHRALAKVRVAHQVSFDDRIMRIAMLRAGLTREMIEDMERCPTLCTLQASTRIVNLPPTAKMLAAGRNNPKPPKLAECIRHFFAEDLDGAHDALVDVRACARVFLKLRELGAWPPKVAF